MNKVQPYWNHLEFYIFSDPGWNKYDYHIVGDDIHAGDDINWYLPWHFALEDDAECPVAPIIVERADENGLLLSYRSRHIELSLKKGKCCEAKIEDEKQVKPTHTWDGFTERPAYRFSLRLILSHRDKLYGSTDKEQFQSKPHYIRTSDLPPGVRTMQQIDHDAWEEAVARGLI